MKLFFLAAVLLFVFSLPTCYADPPGPSPILPIDIVRQVFPHLPPFSLSPLCFSLSISFSIQRCFLTPLTKKNSAI